jgi:hypothetical protein
MALTTDELYVLKYHLGFHLLEAGAEPWAGINAIFEQIIQPYLQSGAITTSSTAVTAAGTPTPATLTLADPDGFTVGARVALDVDSRQEVATVQSVSGPDIRLLLSLEHDGTYPVTVEGGEAIVRRILRILNDIGDKLGGAGTFSAAGLKRVDEVWFDNSTTVHSELQNQLAYWRNELSLALGVRNYRAERANQAGSIALY